MFAFLADTIASTMNFFSVGKKYGDGDEAQLGETARLVLSRYPNLTIADIRLCFDQAKAGRYGKLFDVLDGSVVLGWVDQYFTDKLAEYEKMNQERSNQFKGGYIPPALEPTVMIDGKEAPNPIVESIKQREERRRKEQEERTKAGRKAWDEQNAQAKAVMDGWIAEFSKLHEQQAEAGKVQATGQRFVMMDRKVVAGEVVKQSYRLDLNEYLMLKITEHGQQ